MRAPSNIYTMPLGLKKDSFWGCRLGEGVELGGAATPRKRGGVRKATRGGKDENGMVMEDWGLGGVGDRSSWAVCLGPPHGKWS